MPKSGTKGGAQIKKAYPEGGGHFLHSVLYYSHLRALSQFLCMMAKSRPPVPTLDDVSPRLQFDRRTSHNAVKLAHHGRLEFTRKGIEHKSMKARTYSWSQAVRGWGLGRRQLKGVWWRWGAIVMILFGGFLAGCGRGQNQPVAASEAGGGNGLPGEVAARADPVPPTNVEKRVPGSKLPLYELTINPNELSTLDAQSYSTVSYPAVFQAEGQTYTGVKVRLRGRWSRVWPKKSLEIVFDKDHPFGGRHNLNLNSGWRDPAFVREAVAYHVYARCGAATLLSRMVRLDANDKFRGCGKVH